MRTLRMAPPREVGRAAGDAHTAVGAQRVAASQKVATLWMAPPLDGEVGLEVGDAHTTAKAQRTTKAQRTEVAALRMAPPHEGVHDHQFHVLLKIVLLHAALPFAPLKVVEAWRRTCPRAGEGHHRAYRGGGASRCLPGEWTRPAPRCPPLLGRPPQRARARKQGAQSKSPAQ